MRKTSLIFLAGIALLLGAALWTIKLKRDAMPTVILARYPQTATFRRVVQGHLQGIPTPKPLLMTSFFSKGSIGSIQQCNIDYRGKEHSYREAVYHESREMVSGAIQANHELQLNAGAVRNLRVMLAQLPPSEPPGSVGDVVLVSFECRGAWKTCIYNRKALPPEVTLLLLFTEQTNLPGGIL